ncbi:F-type H+-transporting ATPase subunit b [Oxalobacteraceae bacterium GrIS 2.11]
MLIDWFTVIAQIANFLILVWLMQRYLYHPILTAIDAREKRIATELGDADLKAKDAARERDLFQQKNQQFEQERNTLMKAAHDRADAEQQTLLEAARQTAAALLAQHNAAMLTARKTLEQGLATAIQQEAFAIARQTLSGLANVDLETQISQAFIQHLADLDAQSKTALLAAIRLAQQSVELRSAFTLAQPERDNISRALKLLSGTELSLKFTVSSDLGCGIELCANGQKLAWSIADYLDSLDTHVNAVLDSVSSDPGPVAGQAKP